MAKINEIKANSNLERVRFLAKVYGWQEVKFDEGSYMVRFRKSGVVVNVWYSKMTVGTVLDHPKLGTTQLFRKSVRDELMEKIFINPRVHTKKGYQVKRSTNLDRWYR
jgi:hypothetical protein